MASCVVHTMSSEMTGNNGLQLVVLWPVNVVQAHRDRFSLHLLLY